jgi:hypothetical protein
VNQEIRSLAVAGSTLLAGTQNGIFASTDIGATWGNVGATIRDADSLIRPDPDSISIPKISVSGSTVFLATNWGCSYRAVVDGSEWTWGFQMMRFPRSVAVIGNRLFSASVAIPYADVHHAVNRSEDDGLTWSPADGGLSEAQGSTRAMALAVAGGRLFVLLDINGDSSRSEIWTTMDDGDNWLPFMTGLPASSRITSMAVFQGTLFAALSPGGIWMLENAATTIPQNREPSMRNGSGQIRYPLKHGRVVLPGGTPHGNSPRWFTPAGERLQLVPQK